MADVHSRKRTRTAGNARPWWNGLCCGGTTDIASDMEAMRISDHDPAADPNAATATRTAGTSGNANTADVAALARKAAIYQVPVAGGDSSAHKGAGRGAAPTLQASWSSSPLARRFMVHDGKIYFGPYEVTRTLGRGMQAKVKLARDTGTNELVALKVVDVTEMSPRHLQHIRREVNALRQINHPNVVCLKDVVEDARLPRAERAGDKTVLVMILELASGGELFDFLLYTGHFSEVMGRTYFKQLLSALAACHDLGIYHRDIKPENILLDGNFQLKLGDFGLSGTANADGTDVCSTYCGTRSYMAPEVLAEGSYGGAKADVWSAAVVLFIMLAGSPPMRLANSTDWWFKAILLGRHDKFWQAHERVCPHFPQSAEPILSRMFVADSSKRASVAELLEDPWLAEEHEVLTPEGLREEVRLRKEAVDHKKEAERQAVLQKKAVDLASKRRNQVYDAFERNVERAAHYNLSAADAAGGGSLRLPPPLQATPEEGDKDQVASGFYTGPAAYSTLYLMGAAPEELVGRVAACSRELGAVVKVKAEAWVVKATFPPDVAAAAAGDTAPRARIAFRFFTLQQAADPADPAAGAHMLTVVQPERVEGDVFATRDAVRQLRQKLGNAVCAGDADGSTIDPSGDNVLEPFSTGEAALQDDVDML